LLSGLILSAGASSRMKGRIKALLPLKGKTFLDTIIAHMRRLPLSEIVVILGAHADKVKEEADLKGISVLVNDNWSAGQLSSLRTGIRNLSDSSEGILFTLVDHPLVREETYRVLIEVWQKDKSRIVLPSFNCRKGHPAVFPKDVCDIILKEELREGARTVLTAMKERVLYVTVDDPGVVRDVDTPEDYIKLEESA